MTKDEMLLNYKLSLLKRAKEINNISKACRELGMSRSIYYKYLKRYLKNGREGIYDKKRAKPVMPNETRGEIVEKILDFVKRYPTYSPVRIANELENIVCPATVYNILKRNKLNKKLYRLLALEEVPLNVKLSPILARKLNDAKPNNILSYYTGYLLSMDTFYVCTLKGIGRIYQFTAIDTYSSFGFAYLYTDKSAKSAVDFTSKVLDILSDMGITVKRILTDNGKEYISHTGVEKVIFSKSI